ncbi:MAG TPA: glyoxalase/bleomycin resistance/dioxygenase family protein [Acidimicrobiaceae bacterium]|nr:glyoxalase/bleomycin resistance/dioxygenase family protein [Acidimicrobiaceae bacterium]
MSRVQLALNVDDIDAAIAFYSKLFATAPAKVRNGYANFAIAEPPLKLVLIENKGQGGTLNHLGVEVMSTDEVGAAITRLQSEGLVTDVEENTTCCYAVQDKVWVHGPNGEPWEVYTVLADAPVMHKVPVAGEAVAEAGCCGTGSSTSEPVAEPVAEPVTMGAPASRCC